MNKEVEPTPSEISKMSSKTYIIELRNQLAIEKSMRHNLEEELKGLRVNSIEIQK